MLGDVDMQDTPAIVADDKEAVEDTEGDCGHGEDRARQSLKEGELKMRR